MFESIANDGRTSDKDVSIADAPDVAGEFENNNIDDNVITVDNDDGNNDDYSDTKDISSDDNDDDSTQEDYVSTDDNINSTTNPPDASPIWIQVVAMADGVNHANNNDPNNYNSF